MSCNCCSPCNHTNERVFIMSGNSDSRYGFFKFCGDVFMTCLTGGFWLIWIFIREMRKRNV